MRRDREVSYAATMNARTIFWLICFGLLGLFCTVMAVRDVPELLRTRTIWSTGKTATEATYAPAITAVGVGPETFAHFGGIAWSFDLRLSYTTEAGEQRTSRTRFFRFGSALDFSTVPAPGDVRFRGGREPFEVRYLEAQPDEATASWASHARRDGWILVVLYGIVAAGCFGIIAQVLRGGEVVFDVLRS
jgi:hypothetical protein